MDIIQVTDLSALLEGEAIDGSTRATSIVTRTNALITEKWDNAVDPAPQSVKDLALAVAARAWWIVPGQRQLESVTRSFDDSSRTDRYATSQGGPPGRDVYLTADELADLNGGSTTGRSRVGSIRLKVPGE